jgi:hypothetical protein
MFTDCVPAIETAHFSSAGTGASASSPLTAAKSCRSRNRSPTAHSSRRSRGAWRWPRMLDDGVYATVSEIGDAENISKSCVSRTLRLVLLAPDIVEFILAGQADRGLMLESLELRCRRAGESSGDSSTRATDHKIGSSVALARSIDIAQRLTRRHALPSKLKPLERGTPVPSRSTLTTLSAPLVVISAQFVIRSTP